METLSLDPCQVGQFPYFMTRNFIVYLIFILLFKEAKKNAYRFASIFRYGSNLSFLVFFTSRVFFPLFLFPFLLKNGFLKGLKPDGGGGEYRIINH